MTAGPDLLSISRALRRAEIEGQPIATLSGSGVETTLEEAYAVQRLGAELKMAEGAKHLGYKVGLTTPEAQAALGTREPNYGHLMDDRVHEDGARLPAASFMTPRVEMELAFVLSKPLQGPDIGIAEVIAATAYVMPAIELCAFRTHLPRKLIDTIADNGASSGVVTGEQRFAPSDIDLKTVVGTLRRNGQTEASGVSAVVMGNPAASVAWLANKLSSQGRRLEAGQLILTGAFAGPIPVSAGDAVLADFGDLGEISIAFT
jgi:2-oxo-hept-3-ene-1,7-dioate hydratase